MACAPHDALLRQVGAYGLTATHVADLSDREIELFILGQEDAKQWNVMMLAWVQSNLINVQLPRGKGVTAMEIARTVLPADRMPAAAQGDPEDLVVENEKADPFERVRALKDRVRRKEAARERKAFWTSPDGRKLARLLGEQEDDP